MRIPNLDSGNPVNFSNANGVSFGIAGDTITASVNAAGGGVAIQGSGTYIGTSGTVVFSNSNGVTFGLSTNNVMTASIPAVSAISGFAVNAATTYTSGTVVFSNANNVSFGTNGQTITILYQGPTMSFFQNMNDGNMVQGSTFNTLSIVPLCLEGSIFPGLMTANTFLVGVNGAGSQSTASGSMIFKFGLYTWNASTLSLLNSVSTLITYAAVSNNSTAYSGFRWLSIHSSQWSVQPVFSQTNYWLGIIASSSNATQSMSFLGQAYLNAQGRFGTCGVAGGASATSLGWFPFMGAYSATTASFPNSIQQSQINAAATSVGNFIPHVILNNLQGNF